MLFPRLFGTAFPSLIGRLKPVLPCVMRIYNYTGRQYAYTVNPHHKSLVYTLPASLCACRHLSQTPAFSVEGRFFCATTPRRKTAISAKLFLVHQLHCYFKGLHPPYACFRYPILSISCLCILFYHNDENSFAFALDFYQTPALLLAYSLMHNKMVLGAP